ncbi:MAG: metabolite traffic protein EboE [Bdellovibrionales bacterium]|nr:metabolite traffic protein EboE [Bdellovibrionales bacterium]
MRLTFCSNIIPGTGLEDHLAQLKTAMPEIKANCPWLKHLGLRLSEAMANQLCEDSAALAEFNQFLDEQGLLVSTANVFPQGEFHQPGVKDNVYLPDWSDSRRVDYTLSAANALSQLQTPDVVSMSTVPLGYKGHYKTEVDFATFVKNLIKVAEHLRALEEQTGKLIRLALEPEPDCLLEFSTETVKFFDLLKKSTQDQELISRYLGVCFDTCHFAVNFENPEQAVQNLVENEVSIFKYQLTSALCWRSPISPQAFTHLTDNVYLHQTRAQLGGQVIKTWGDTPNSHVDLNLDEEKIADEWRCHFHTPLFVENYEEFVGSQADLLAALGTATQFDFDSETDLEVETYTWGVLPNDLKTASVHDCIIEELKWAEARVKDCLHSKLS